MVEQGATKDALAAFMLHVNSATDVGMISSRPGVMLASSATFNITISGKGGHAASPFTAIDPVNAAAQVILSINTMVGRMFDNANDPVLLSVTTVHGGDAPNIIPNTMIVTGTIRTLRLERTEDVKQLVKERAVSVSDANGCSASVAFRETGNPYTNTRGEHFYRATSPETYNAPEMYEFGRKTAISLFRNETGPINVDAIFNEIASPKMGAEDFSFYARVVPSCAFNIGHRSDEDTANNHHHPKFQVDEAMIHKGAAFYAMLALDFLSDVQGLPIQGFAPSAGDTSGEL